MFGRFDKLYNKIMQNYPVRILHFLAGMDGGGVETLLINILKNIDRNKVAFDFCLVPDKRYFYDDEMKQYGCRIYTYPFKKRHNLLLGFYAFTVVKAMICGKYDIIHTHYRKGSALILILAFLCGVKNRICHCHMNPLDNKGMLDKFSNFLAKKIILVLATKKLSCSTEAGNNWFGKNQFELFKNGVETETYAFNPQVRKEIREKYNLGEKFVLLNVGRFNPEKNHSFLIDVFESVQKKHPDCVLLLAGEGKTEKEIREKVKKLNLEEKVLFLGSVKNVSALYSACDVFVLTSVFEGFPVVLTEAQCGLVPCVVSDSVTREANLTEYKTCSLQDSREVWADAVLEYVHSARSVNHNPMKENGYDIKSVASNLSDIYLSL